PLRSVYGCKQALSYVFRRRRISGNPSRLPHIAVVRLRHHVDGNEYSPDGGRSRSRRGARSIKAAYFRTVPPGQFSASRREPRRWASLARQQYSEFCGELEQETGAASAVSA